MKLRIILSLILAIVTLAGISNAQSRGGDVPVGGWGNDWISGGTGQDSLSGQTIRLRIAIVQNSSILFRLPGLTFGF